MRNTGKTIRNVQRFVKLHAAQQNTNNSLNFLALMNAIEVIHNTEQNKWVDHNLFK